ncbi:hypothetical protein N7530_005981 [Penicillium desertorum]|uniref:Uncharacterized protein n=1 Tax=Penicillium desertorum TaxID=1303715 RepID=A0A9X0BS78_9EURO|nr:hypothetical protein N7530_005981 [Penicillium desertorum]
MSPSDYLALKIKAAMTTKTSGQITGERSAQPECPPVPAITYLSFYGVGRLWLIDPASSVFIALKLPRLNGLGLCMKDECKGDEKLRQRLHFARNLHLFPASVRNLDLQFHNVPPIYQDYPPPDVTVGGTDLLSSHLRNFSQQLESLDTNQSVVGPELFWPFSPQDDDIKLPFWPNLIDPSVEYTADDDTVDAYQSFEDDEVDYPEHLRILLEDSKRRYF